MLETYPNKKIILTGANDEQMVLFSLDTMPYPVFTLKHDPEKTDPQYYQTMLAQYNLQANEVIYFEHDEGAVQSAQSIGIHTYHYNKDTKDLVALQKFIDDIL
jgi:FMN phosphatase YigB (HAD superfamily)